MTKLNNWGEEQWEKDTPQAGAGVHFDHNALSEELKSDPAYDPSEPWNGSNIIRNDAGDVIGVIIGQSKADSIRESLTNIAIGWFVALCGQMYVWWHYDLPITFWDNVNITIFFTVISFIRSYCLRRIFNRRSLK